MIARFSSKFLAPLYASLLAFVFASNAHAAPAVRVTLQVDQTNLKVGDFTTAHVMAEIVSSEKTNTTQIFSWYVDLIDSAPTIFQIDPTTIIVPKSDSDPSTSSKGTFTAGSLRGVYDTFFNASGAGHDAPIELFSVRVKAIAVGAANLSVAAGSGAPAIDEDFIVATVSGDPLFGGLYDTATSALTSFNNVPPTLDPIQNLSVAEGSLATVTAVGHDTDVGQTLRYSLVGAPASGALIDPITGVFSWTPAESQGPGTFAFRVKVADNGTPPMSATNDFIVAVTEINTRPNLQVPVTINTAEGQNISALCTATDADILRGKTPSTNLLTFSLVNPPSGASINPTTGAFSWTPTEQQGPSNYVIKVMVVDDGVPPMAATNSFNINVSEVNLRPTITAPADQTINEGATLNVAFVGKDSDLPANALTYSVVNAPPGVILDPNTGLITWTPTEAQGPGTYTIAVAVSDNAPTPLFQTNSFQVTVNELNSAPVLDLLPDRTVNEGTTLTFTAIARDTDLPAQTLTFALDNPPLGASINPTSGAFTWRPSESQGPGIYTVVVRLTDNGTPARSDTKSFEVVVNEVNTAPVLTTPAGQGTQTVAELTPVNIQFTATDTDLPVNLITFSIENAPVGAALNAASGFFSWTPTEAQGPGGYTFRVIATDNGVPPLSTTNTISIVVTEANTAPVIDAIEDQIIDELTTLTVPVLAHDDDLPAQTITYSLDNPPAGAAINATTGVFTWTPTEAQGPGQFIITVRARESGAAALSSTRSFLVTVNEVNSAPVVQIPAPFSRAENAPMTLPITVTDSDILNGQTPNTNRFTFVLQSGPEGATINAQTGVISWTPTEAQGPGSYQLRVVATDDGVPALSGEGIITVNVTEANRPPSITAPAARSIAELTPLNVSFTASDLDVPANALTFALIAAPAGVQLDSASGAITWTPTEAQGPGSYTITVAVADNGSPVLRATNSMSVTVTEVNTKPTLNSIPNYTLGIGGTINFQASASDSDIPAQTLTFSLDSAPSGATINPNTGVFIWTPGANQANGPQTVTIRVTESGAAALFDTKTFTIQVTGATSNTPPVIFSPANQTMAAGSTLSLTNIASDTDIPANTLTFSIVSAPTGATINAATGALNWTPTSAQTGQSQFQIRVTDNGAPPLSATNSFSVTVTNTTAAPPATLKITSVDLTGTTLRVEGPPNSSYDLEYSTDFTSWTRVTTVSLGAQTFAIHLDAIHGFGQIKGFYRAKSAGGGSSAQPTALTVSHQSVDAGGLVLRVNGDAGFTYTIQFSTDLINWSPVGTLPIATGGSADFTDSAQPTRGAKGFYRAIFP
jgi:hypothetical protein